MTSCLLRTSCFGGTSILTCSVTQIVHRHFLTQLYLQAFGIPICRPERKRPTNTVHCLWYPSPLCLLCLGKILSHKTGDYMGWRSGTAAILGKLHDRPSLGPAYWFPLAATLDRPFSTPERLRCSLVFPIDPFSAQRWQDHCESSLCRRGRLGPFPGGSLGRAVPGRWVRSCGCGRDTDARVSLLLLGPLTSLN